MSTSQTATVQGVPMRWEEAGEGHPVVLVHGIPTSPALWRHVMPHVRGARCLAWEMVGYGESMAEGRDRDISIQRQADYLLAWLDEISINRAVLVGHDLGGGVAQIAAVRRPERCAGLLLTNSIAYDSWPIPAVQGLQRTTQMLRRLPAPAIPAALSALFFRGHDDPAVALESLRVHGRAYARPGGSAALARQVQWLDVRDTLTVAPELPRLQVPCRMVWGAADQFQEVRYGERLAADLDAPLQRIEGGKHFTPENHPGAIAAATNELVRIPGDR